MPQDEALQATAEEVPATANVGKQIDRHEKALLQGDLSDLSNQERKSFYAEVCDSLGLNPMTQPLEYIWLSGDLTLYANKTAANQLRDLHGVSITDLDIQQENGLHTVYAYAEDKTGRTDVDAGIVDVGNARGEALANAKMKAITKAKRRVTLSICGLGFLDETEVEDIPDGATKAANVDHETGEMKPRKPDSWYEGSIRTISDKVYNGDVGPKDVDYSEVPKSHPIDEWPAGKRENLKQAISEAVEGRFRDDDPSGKETRASASTTPSSGQSHSQERRQEDTESTQTEASKRPETTDRKYDGHADALNSIFDDAWAEGKENWEAISDAQLNRMYAIADDNGWKESWLDRLVKDELGYESKAAVPYGDPYDEICEALESDELRFWMSRDPDTPDMFKNSGEDFPDEESEELPFN